MRRTLTKIGRPLVDFVTTLGRMFILFLRAMVELVWPPLHPLLIMRELFHIGLRSLGVVGLLGLFIGMILVVQTGYSFQRFGSVTYVGPLVALAMYREIGPVLSGFMIAGRVGSGIAAELGAMQVSEQIDAMRALGANPVRKLVAPRLAAGAIALPLLVALADGLGTLGGLLMAHTMFGVSTHGYFSSITAILRIGDFTSGVFKSVFFGLIIITVACYEGLNTRQGTVGVGRATTRTVVLSCIFIILADYILTSIMVSLPGFVSASQ